jgi:hypothetical protein
LADDLTINFGPTISSMPQSSGEEPNENTDTNILDDSSSSFSADFHDSSTSTPTKRKGKRLRDYRAEFLQIEKRKVAALDVATQ